MKRNFIGTVGVVGVLIIAIIVGIVSGTVAAEADGEPVVVGPIVVTVSLSEVLAVAQEHGPGFAEVRRMTRSRELDSALTEARTLPTLTVTGQTELHPDLRQGISAHVQWEFHDDFILAARVGRAWSPTSSMVGEGSGGGEDRATLSFSRKLWPPANSPVERQMDELERHGAELNEFGAFADAYGQVIDAFYNLDQALRGEKMATTRLELARAAARQIEEGFVRGDRGLKEWQEAQQAERQALVALRGARTARVEAATRLQRILGEDAVDNAAMRIDVPSHALELHDDLNWALFMEEVGAVLAMGRNIGGNKAREDDVPGATVFGDGVSGNDRRGNNVFNVFGGYVSDGDAPDGDGLLARFLAMDAGYVQAQLAELRAVQALDKVSSDRNVRWDAEAAYSLPLSSSGSSSGSGGPSGGSPGGHLTAFIGASWQWEPGSRLSVEKARLALQSAKENTRVARQQVEDGASRALRAVDDAEFALEVARLGVEQARKVLDVVQRRVELGFAGPLELAQAQLDVEQAEAEELQAHSALYKAWLDVARRLGFSGAPPR